MRAYNAIVPLFHIVVIPRSSHRLFMKKLPKTATTTVSQQSAYHTLPKVMATTLLAGITMTLLLACNHPVMPLEPAKSAKPVLNQPTPQPHNRDALQGLIHHRQHQPAPLPLPKNSGEIYSHNADFKAWLDSHSYQKSEILAYQNYLQSQLGTIPPIDQLIASARDARACGFEPYEVPPAALWSNIVPTLRLLQQLKQQGYLPMSTVIRSVYRNPSLNQCAGGAGESKHMTNGAIDIWVPENEGNRWAVESTNEGLCQFWQYNGQAHNFGLGLYASGAVHLDTQGYRKWGGNHSATSSPCRY